METITSERPSSTKPPGRRKRFMPGERGRVLERYHKSGLTQEAFCGREQISKAALAEGPVKFQGLKAPVTR